MVHTTRGLFPLAIAVLAISTTTAPRTVGLGQEASVEDGAQSAPIMRPDGLGPQLECGTPDADPEVAQLVDEYSQRMASRVLPQLTASQTIPVSWHRIHRQVARAASSQINRSTTSWLS